jgi:hypothetical protein
MSRVVSPSTERADRVLRVTQIWGRWRPRCIVIADATSRGRGCRRGPVRAMPDEALVQAIRKLLAGSPAANRPLKKSDWRDRLVE